MCDITFCLLHLYPDKKKPQNKIKEKEKKNKIKPSPLSTTLTKSKKERSLLSLNLILICYVSTSYTSYTFWKRYLECLVDKFTRR